MGQIPKSYAISVAVLGIVSLILGFGVAISSWMLKAKTDDMIIIEGNISSNATFSHETDIQIFDSYWWGGFFYLIPGLLGILAGCTKQRIVMFLYVVLNSACVIASTVACFLVGHLKTFWQLIDGFLQNHNCFDHQTAQQFCLCADVKDISTANDKNTYSILNAKCSELDQIDGIILAILIMVAIATAIAGLSSCLGCCGLCQREIHESTTVSYKAGPYVGGGSIRRGAYQQL